MSVVDQLKNLFAKKAPDSENDSRLSLAMPDAMMDPIVTEQRKDEADNEVQIPAAQLGSVPDAGDGSVEDSADLIALPILGKKTVVQHQRLLSILLGLALVVLAVVTLFAVSQGNRVAQQMEATGNSLMQSQRLAKSVSQALVGGVKAFPDVAESAGVLATSIRGMVIGDAQMGLDALSADYQPVLSKITPMMERAEKNDGAGRKECGGCDGAAENPDAGGCSTSSYQSAVFRSAGNRRNCVIP